MRNDILAKQKYKFPLILELTVKFRNITLFNFFFVI